MDGPYSTQTICGRQLKRIGSGPCPRKGQPVQHLSNEVQILPNASPQMPEIDEVLYGSPELGFTELSGISSMFIKDIGETRP